MYDRLLGRANRLDVRRPGCNVRNSAREAWVAEANSTSAAPDSKTGVRRAKAAPAPEMRSTAEATDMAATTKVSATTATKMTTTAAAASTAVGTCPSGVS